MEMIALTVLASSLGVRVVGTGLSGTAAISCFAVGRSARRRKFWWGLGVIQMALMVDAMLGLRTMAAEMGREVIKAHGWYGQRAWPQAVATVIGMVVVLSAAGWVVVRLGRERSRQMAAAGTGLEIMIFLMRVVSLHQVDKVLSWPAASLNAGMALRGMGVALVCAGAWWEMAAASAPPRLPADDQAGA